MKRFLICLLISSSCTHAATPLAEWHSKDAAVTDVITINEHQGGPNLVGSQVGVTVENDPENGKILRFDGTEGVLTSDGRITGSGNVKISASVRLADNPGQGAIVRWDNMELRHSGNQRTILFVVWHEGGHTEVSLPHRIDEWVTVSGSIKGNSMRLEVDGDHIEKEISGEYLPKPAIIYVGMGLGRPLIGDVAEVRIEDIEN